MVKVAVAGGTGGLGRAIVGELANSDHETIVLTREHNINHTMIAGATLVAIDYTNVEAIVRTLNDHQIHTVISSIVIKSLEQSEAQINLIRAAEATPSVKRFTPSEFGTPRLDASIKAGAVISTSYKDASIAELEKTHLEYTLFSHGVFMDYYGMPKCQSYLTPWVFAIDIAHKVAGIPGSGNVPAVYTYSGDVAKFVVAATGLPDGTWHKHSIMIGDRRTLNEVLGTAESIRGRFKVQYDTMQKLQQGEITELPSHTRLYSQTAKELLQRRFAGFGIGMETGAFDFNIPANGVLLNDLFPNIQVKSVEDIIIEGWAKNA
ncbi:uncharacterized protein Triagg1_10179 [Trichoderma aggressivum f. europaeum]|uniref:NmrA-like domain-containing protein n=1 Tax=Trichoderma aggressivum f. europaeum TaxID=173218 RepID=A0AAE1LVW9_9HYPO|nr:hypothetical protein Triagg1_10179 [Trichoderma aggressivum f. europaeum]